MVLFCYAVVVSHGMVLRIGLRLMHRSPRVSTWDHASGLQPWAAFWVSVTQVLHSPHVLPVVHFMGPAWTRRAPCGVGHCMLQRVQEHTWVCAHASCTNLVCEDAHAGISCRSCSGHSPGLCASHVVIWSEMCSMHWDRVVPSMYAYSSLVQ